MGSLSVKEQERALRKAVLAWHLRNNERVSEEQIAERLEYGSSGALRKQFENWELPDWLIGTETRADKKKTRQKSTPPRLRSVGPRQDLPPAANAAELFKERLEALREMVELLEHVNEALYDKHFGRTNMETASVLQDGRWMDDAVASLPGPVARTPTEIEAILIGVYALADGQMDLLLEKLHPDSLSASAETREEIRQYVRGSRSDGDKRDGLKGLARNLAGWVRGGEPKSGRRSELPATDHEVASITKKYRKDGLTDEEITRKVAHLEKADGTHYSVKDVTELGDSSLSWS